MSEQFRYIPYSPYDDNLRGLVRAGGVHSLRDARLPENDTYNVSLSDVLIKGDERADELMRDSIYMKELYPEDMKQLSIAVEEECDKLEYEGSPMFMEYPDREEMRRVARTVYETISDEAAASRSGQQPNRPPYGGQQQNRPPQGGQQPNRPPQGGQQQNRPPQGGQQPNRPLYGGQQQNRPPQGGQQQNRPPYGGQQPNRPPYGGQQPNRPPQGGQRPDRPPRSQKNAGGCDDCILRNIIELLVCNEFCIRRDRHRQHRRRFY